MTLGTGTAGGGPDNILDIDGAGGASVTPAPRPRPQALQEARPALRIPLHGTIYDSAVWWKRELDRADYFIDIDDAKKLALNLQLRGAPLLLEGPPGSGKTSLVYAVARVLKQSRVERINCFRNVSVEKLLYGWDRALQDLEIARAERAAGGDGLDDYTHVRFQPKCMKPGVFVRAFRSTDPHTIVLINEIDKTPAEEEFEATALEVMDEHAITVEETGERLTPVTGLPPHCFITSNAGVRGSSERESLTHPTLRRCDYIHLPEPDRERQYDVLRAMARQLHPRVIRECALFLEAMRDMRMQKPVALSEGIRWARTLQLFPEFSTLTPRLVEETTHVIAKSIEDRERLKANLGDLFRVVESERGWRPKSEPR